MGKSNIYIKGFNAGYFLTQHDSDLLDQLLTASPGTGDYITGLRDGKSELEREVLLNKLKTRRKDRKDREL